MDSAEVDGQKADVDGPQEVLCFHRRAGARCKPQPVRAAFQGSEADTVRIEAATEPAVPPPTASPARRINNRPEPRQPLSLLSFFLPPPLALSCLLVFTCLALASLFSVSPSRGRCWHSSSRSLSSLVVSFVLFLRYAFSLLCGVCTMFSRCAPRTRLQSCGRLLM